jgi:predicted RNA-binding protein with PIN domain
MRGPAGVPHYLVDGYNVILSGSYGSKEAGSGRGRRVKPSIYDERFHFLRLLSEYVRRKRVRMTVVWDGGSTGTRSRSETKNGVQNIFTPSGLSADEQIIRLVEKRENPREVTVVSDDRRHIIGVARNLGAQTMTVAQFIGLISPEARRQVHRAPERSRDGETERREATGGDRTKRGSPFRGSPSGRVPSGEDAAVEKKRADDLSVDEWMKLFELKKNRGGKES